MLEVKTYKNYKELCQAMKWKPTGGDTKVKNLKILESICKYHKEGYKFIIEEIYDKPKPIEDNRGNIGIFKPLLEEIIIHRLSSEGKTVDNKLSWTITKRQLMNCCGLCNENMSILSYYCDMFGDYFNMNKEYLKELCDDFYVNNRQLMERTLTRLEKESKLLIDRNRHNVIKNKNHDLATKEEEKFIMDINEKILAELNCKTMQEIKFKNLFSRYIKLVSKEIEDNKYGIDSFYSVYVITPNSNFEQRILTAKKENKNRKIVNKERIEQFKTKHEDKNIKLLIPIIEKEQLTLSKTNGKYERLGRETQEEKNIKNRNEELELFIKVAIDIEYGYRYYVNDVRVEKQLENGEKKWTTKKEIVKVIKNS